MNNDMKKEYLNSYQSLKTCCQILAENIEEFMASRYLPSLPVSGMPSAHNKTDLSAMAVRYDEMITELVHKRYDRIKKYSEIETIIDALTDENEKTILRLRYLSGLRWDKICEKTGYSWRHTHRLHGKALNNIVIPNDSK